MKVRIGVSDANRVVEIEVENVASFEKRLVGSFAGDETLLWFDDVKGRRIAIPREKLAFVEIEGLDIQTSVGFG